MAISSGSVEFDMLVLVNLETQVVIISFYLFINWMDAFWEFRQEVWIFTGRCQWTLRRRLSLSVTCLLNGWVVFGYFVRECGVQAMGQAMARPWRGHGQAIHGLGHG